MHFERGKVPERQVSIPSMWQVRDNRIKIISVQPHNVQVRLRILLRMWAQMARERSPLQHNPSKPATDQWHHYRPIPNHLPISNHERAKIHRPGGHDNRPLRRGGVLRRYLSVAHDAGDAG